MNWNAKDGNEVHKQTIWAETIRKELAHRSDKDSFSINPHQLRRQVLTEPVSVRPKRFMDKDTQMLNTITRQLKRDPFRDSRRQRLEEMPALPKPLSKALNDVHKLPTTKYSYPQTSSQDIGWMSKPLKDQPRHSRFNHFKGSCDITRYADHIISASHLDPFKNQNARKV
eukprot:TRINITY_DN67332_c8_g3_i1.p1 TRINITY_DN67332_c8_g3~~TRINITY_DN67332_c8_g3_i1.p1  ORF type:complete len:170 (-),score=22.19 TRINITY_DN67332_c8_g3_i1:522-1031(-)